MMSRFYLIVWVFSSLFHVTALRIRRLDDVPQDTFTFADTDQANHKFGPADWNLISCNDVDSCPGWPTNWKEYNPFIPYDASNNMCRDCASSTSGSCFKHQQSPIALFRNITATKECKDRHKMHYTTGNCRWNEMDFKLLTHVLRAYQPEDCQVDPTIDFSWGFPDRWLLKFTDFVVPSHHTQDGKQYRAEVILSHVYSKNKDDKLIGNVAVFLDEGTDADHRDFLELYLQQFLNAAAEVEQKCFARKLAGAGNSNSEYAKISVQEASRKLDDTTLPVDFIQTPEYIGSFNPYWWVQNCGTDYYFRYNGSTPEPPCFEGVNWRVMKDAIAVSPRQIQILEQLFLRRLNPDTCRPDSAGKPRSDGSRVDVNRPLQTVRDQHRLVFCECADWVSYQRNDKNYCKLPMEERGVFRVTGSN